MEICMLELKTGIEIKGKYVIHEPAGTGGSAFVWKASDKQLNRYVALKRLLKPSLSSEAELSKQLISEAQRNAQLIHTNIVQVYDIVEEQGEYLMVMEYVNGQPLYELLREKARNTELLPLDTGIDLLRDILDGVSFAHSRDICHRDLSPMNVLLTAQGVPKIADFGIARSITTNEPDEPQAGTGNPNYMSPEQSRGEPADFSSDLFMTGIIGYLLLTGRHPFCHPSGLFSIPELLKQPDYNPEAPRAPSTFTTTQQRLFREYAAIVMRLLHREGAGRYDSARAVINALDAVEPFIECPSCGERMPEHYRFCGGCGTALAMVNESSLVPVMSAGVTRTAEELCNEGYQSSRQRNWEPAVQKYLEALAIDPKHLRTIWNLGFVLNRLGHYDEAEQYLTTGLLLDRPEHRASMLYERSVARTNLKKYEDALSDIHAALERQPKSAKFLYLKVRVHLYRAEIEEAKRTAQNVLQLVPDHSGALRLLESVP
jgi:serine/threonine protein kinase